MIVSRAILSAGTQGAKGATFTLRQLNNGTALAPIGNGLSIKWTASRAYHINTISNNLSLITTANDVKIERDPSSSTVTVNQKQSKPLAVFLPWLMAKQAHLKKYASFYIDQGFDILVVNVSPWQFLWPVKGSQVVAGELVEFLHKNYKYDPLMVHGFSVGGYVWGEVCVKLHAHIDRYQPIVDRVVGQVWDSAVELTGTALGVSRAVFPTNIVMQRALNNYIEYHMRTFHDVATCHYIRSSQMFHTNLVKAPALFLVSKTDPIGSEESNRRVHDSWGAHGVKTFWKCWEKSQHVGHYRKYPKEYAAELYGFLNMLNLVQDPEKIRAKM